MTTSISELFLEPSMWWHADLPAPRSAPGPTGTPPEPEARGEFLLEWILPTLAGEVIDDDIDAPATGGSARRLVRRTMRASPTGL